MKKHFLIDFENVADEGLNGFADLAPEDTVELFYTEKAGKISIDFMRSIQLLERHARIEFVKVTSGHQALDMQLATYLGSILTDDAEYFIISRDNGYAHVVRFWSDNRPGVRIQLKKTIAACLRTEAVEPAEPIPAEIPVPAPVAEPQEPKQEAKQEAKPQSRKGQRGGGGQKAKPPVDRNTLNTQIQQALSKAGYDTNTIAQVASMTVKSCDDAHAKNTAYKSIIKKFGQKKGLDLYNHIRGFLK